MHFPSTIIEAGLLLLFAISLSNTNLLLASSAKSRSVLSVDHLTIESTFPC